MHLIHQLSTSQATAHTLTSPCKAQHHLLQVEKEEGACDSTQEIIYLGKKQRSHFRVISKKGMWAKAINPKMYISAEACASGMLNRHQNTSVKHTDMSLQDHSNTTGHFTSMWKKRYIWDISTFFKCNTGLGFQFRCRCSLNRLFLQTHFNNFSSERVAGRWNFPQRRWLFSYLWNKQEVKEARPERLHLISERFFPSSESFQLKLPLHERPEQYFILFFYSRMTQNSHRSHEQNMKERALECIICNSPNGVRNY